MARCRLALGGDASPDSELSGAFACAVAVAAGAGAECCSSAPSIEAKCVELACRLPPVSDMDIDMALAEREGGPTPTGE